MLRKVLVAIQARLKTVKQKHQMTRKERHDSLAAMWGNMPLNEDGITDESKFFAWQGRAATLLNFNPRLQSEFQNVIKSRPPTDDYSLLVSHPGAYKPMCDRIHTILAQAIEELAIPEEVIVPVLTNEQGIWWFLDHCTLRSKITLACSLAVAALAIFGFGFKLGQTEWAKTLFREYNSLPSPAPTSAPTVAQPNK